MPRTSKILTGIATVILFITIALTAYLVWGNPQILTNIFGPTNADEQKMQIRELSVQELKTLHAKIIPGANPILSTSDRKKILFLDLRTSEEYRIGHVQYAKNLPYEAIQAQNFSLPQSDVMIILYGNTGILSNKKDDLADYLNRQKVVQVYLVVQPYSEWASQLTQDMDTEFYERDYTDRDPFLDSSTAE